MHSFCEQFEWDNSLECFWLDVIGEGFVHAEGAFANVLTVCITHNAIEKKRLRTGRLGANLLHDTDSSLGLLHADRCADQEGA
jgi:hypothetical protein